MYSSAGLEGYIEEACFTLSARGQFKLVHMGYGYTKMCVSSVTGITTWRCASNGSYPELKCRAKCYTRQVGVLQRVKSVGDHTHPKKIAPRLPQKKTSAAQKNGKKKLKSKLKSKLKPKMKVNQESKSIKLKANLVEELKK